MSLRPLEAYSEDDYSVISFKEVVIKRNSAICPILSLCYVCKAIVPLHDAECIICTCANYI